ncbi:AraC family transcriptional regulator [Niastella koreensis]|uniref:Transcriptional regulator, AraC family n=2 Tax=Niastella koreensis TaxID=354356 RepID=G8TLV1_NIAKG|nr:AraC family transcriptional regulator [Niastella koreensis]AEV97693.1 transcriptional regulator, AraC family [Niastella koreensis GR20-10]OQP40486.1 AraC family transcriptional regulator [Niastella koreensis]
MFFEFEPNPTFDFLSSFAKKFNVSIEGDRLSIPPVMGAGSIRRAALPGGLKLVVHRYKLKEDFILNRVGTDAPNELVSMIFHSNEVTASVDTGEKANPLSRSSAFAIQIASTDLNSKIRFPAHTDIYFLVVGIRKDALKELLAIKNPNSVVQTILNAEPGFLFYESMSVEVHKIVKQVTEVREDNALGNLYQRLKVQELIYLVFEKLQKRENGHHSTVHKDDVEKLSLIRTAILSDLAVPPSLPALAKMAGLGETKMTEIFKQVFGDTIYNYYQQARMEEAAFLLKHGGLSVSETGYQLGFANLSHFGRLFEKYHGVKPKKYTTGG